MCNRTKTEVLARELCFEYQKGIGRNQSTDDVHEFIDSYWENWKVSAGRILETLEKHKTT